MVGVLRARDLLFAPRIGHPAAVAHEVQKPEIQSVDFTEERCVRSILRRIDEDCALRHLLHSGVQTPKGREVLSEVRPLLTQAGGQQRSVPCVGSIQSQHPLDCGLAPAAVGFRANPGPEFALVKWNAATAKFIKFRRLPNSTNFSD
jgi:hypothetical protein